MAPRRYCTELKVSVGGNDRNEDAKGLWQSAGGTSALCEVATRTGSTMGVGELLLSTW